MMVEVSVAMTGEAIEYVADRIRTTPANMQPAIGAAVLKDGKLAGAAVFNNYHVLHKGSWCEVSVAIDDAECVSRRTRVRSNSIFEVPVQATWTRRYIRCSAGLGGLQAKQTSVKEPVRCRSFIERLGFKLEGLARKAHDGEQDAAVYFDAAC